MAYDANKAARVNYYLKQGLSEDEAFAKAGIPASDDAYYSVDGVKNSPTYGQVIAGPAAERPVDPSIKVMSAADKAEIKAREAREAEEDRKLRAKEEADDAAARAREEAEDREAAAREKAEASKQAALDQAKVDANAREAGPSSTRTTNTVTTTGGGETVTKMTPEYREYLDKRGAADTADAAATQAAKDEYLRSKGLDQSTPAEKRKALREAEANGTSFESTANRDSVGSPPPNQYTTTTIPSTTNTESTVNDGTQTDDQSAKESAKGQTAEDAVNNTTPKEIPGEGTVAPDAATITDAEADKIKNNERDSERETELPPNAFPAPAAENKVADPSPYKSQQAQQNTIVGATSNSTQTGISDKNASEKQKELSIKLAKARTNKLHDYASSTYRITMYLLSALDYANLAARPSTFNPKYVLISSGGGYPNPAEFSMVPTGKEASGRHPDFQEDFFIENLNLTTVVGLNSKSKASNAIEIGFTIVEPYGMTLLDRLMSACSMPPVNSPNYIDQPYLLEIDFLANADEETKQNSGIRIDRKRFAIKIIEMKIKPGASGTEYRCRAIPFNHVAFQDTIASMPITLNVQADTLGSFFDSENEISKIFSVDVEKNDERIESELKKWIALNYNDADPGVTKPTDADIQAQRNKIKASLTYTTDSFPAAYNTYMRGVAGVGKTFTYPPSLIAINIPDPEMKKSKIVDEKNTDSKTVPMADRKDGVRDSVQQSNLKDGKTKQGFPISAGTNVVQLIDRVMQSSEYITKQVREAKETIAKSKEIIAERSKLLSDPNTNSEYRQQLEQEKRDAEREMNQYRFLKWYKIIPQTFLLNFDFSRNAYSKQAIYTIQPYQAANAYHPDFDKTRINKSKIVRSYNYLYTGLNQDITAIDIDFDSSYYTAITAYQDNKTKNNLAFSSEPDQNNYATDLDGKQSNPTRVTDLGHSFQTRGVNATATGQMNRANSDKSYAVSDIANSIYTSQRGDMLNVNLRIIGDPAFIKQDDIYVNPMSAEYKEFNTMGAGTEDTVPLNPNTGQIIFDQEQVFVQLIIKSAVDIDDETGITNKQIKLSNGRMTDSTFSGVYKVLTVKSDFSRGKFEQTLTLVKMPNDMFFDDTKPANPNVTVIKPALAKNEDPAASKPPAAPNEDVAQDATNQSAAETARLKAAAAEPATNPVATSSGEGTVASAPQPADAAPANANDAQAVAPQEKAAADQIALIDQFSTDFDAVVEQRRQIISVFNTQATQIENDQTLSKEEQNQKLIALREKTKTDIQAYSKKSTEIFLAAYEIKTVGDAFVPQNALLKRINVFTAQAKADFERQDARIAALKSGTA